MIPHTETSRPRVTEHFMLSPTDLALKVADLTQQSLAAGLSARGHASLVVSGGRTSKRFLPALAQKPLAWERVTVSLADDRFVPPDSPDSNQRLVRECLLQGAAARADLLPLYLPDLTVEEACQVHELSFPASARPFDVVLLGMGEDGHVASIFPSTPSGVIRAERPELFVPGTAPVPPRERISMSPRLLLQSRRIILVFQGEEKRVLFRRALLEGPASTLPVAALIQKESQAELHAVWSPW